MLWERGGLTINAVVSGSSGPDSSPSRVHCVVFLGKTLNDLNDLNAWDNPAMD